MARTRSTGEGVKVDPALYRSVPGWPGYFAGVDGEIYSAKTGGELRRLSPSFVGYKGVLLTDGPKRAKIAVHVLVASAFRGPKPFEGAEVRHLDGIRSNTLPSNLCWGTRKENCADMDTHGTKPRGETHGVSKLTEVEVLAICEDDRTHKEIAEDYGVTRGAVQLILAGRRWGWLTGLSK